MHDAVHDEFVEKLVAATRAMTVGHALEEGTQIGPVVSEGQLAANLNYMDIARKEGGEVLCGGDRVIAEAWDATFTLCDGEVNAAQIKRLSANVPKQEAGRVSDTEMVLSRANKSV